MEHLNSRIHSLLNRTILISSLCLGAFGLCSAEQCLEQARALGYSFYGDFDPVFFENRLTGEELGSEIARLGDVDGDGVQDYLVKAEGDLQSANNGNSLRVYSGSTHQLLEIFGSNGLNHPIYHHGAIGDLNSDGRVDIYYSRSYDDPDGSLISDDIEFLVYTVRPRQLRYRITQPSSASRDWGKASATSPDLNGDGVRELVIVDSFDDCDSAEECFGRVDFYFYSGSNGSLLLHAPTAVQQTVYDPEIRIIPDALGDGAPDILISDSSYGDASGIVFLYSIGGLINGQQGPSHAFSSNFSNANLGENLGWIQDLSGDGSIEILISRPGNDNQAEPGFEPSVGVFSIDASTKEISLIRELVSSFAANEVESFAQGLEVLPDVNGDQIEDIVVATRLVDARTAALEIFSGATGQLITTIIPSNITGGRYGYGTAISLLGDLNGDGLVELAVGSRNDTFGQDESTFVVTSPYTPATFSDYSVWAGMYHVITVSIDTDGDGVREYCEAAAVPAPPGGGSGSGGSGSGGSNSGGGAGSSNGGSSDVAGNGGNGSSQPSSSDLSNYNSASNMLRLARKTIRKGLAPLPSKKQLKKGSSAKKAKLKRKAKKIRKARKQFISQAGRALNFSLAVQVLPSGSSALSNTSIQSAIDFVRQASAKGRSSAEQRVLMKAARDAINSF